MRTKELLEEQTQLLGEIRREISKQDREIDLIMRYQNDLKELCERTKALLIKKGAKKKCGQTLTHCVSTDSLKLSIDTGRYNEFMDRVKAQLSNDALLRNVHIRPYKIRYEQAGRVLFIVSDIIEGDQNDFSFLDNIEIVQGDKA
ncbi:MAG: hypothetical protein IIZ78_00720 [Clostridiales bacterium]|nr:hypothetical protein [Clostridiales bacterium]